MEAHQLTGFGVNSSSISYSPSQPAAASTPSRLGRSLKLDLGASPDSPFSVHFGSDKFAKLSDSQEQYNLAEHLSGIGASYNRPLESCGQESLFHLRNTNNGPSIGYTLEELEMDLMGSDADREEIANPNTSGGEKKPQALTRRRSTTWNKVPSEEHVVQSQEHLASSYQKSIPEGNNCKRQKIEKPVQGTPPGNLKHVLVECARALSENKVNDFDVLVEQARSAISICGEPIERLGAYMVEGLVARKEASGSNIYRALNCRQPESRDLLSYMHILYEICPYWKFGYMAANGAIAEACRNEDRIHIIDFQIAQGTQWMTLLQALAARPGGAPHVRITGIDDPVSEYARGDGLEVVRRRLAAVSEKYNIPVEFHPVPVFGPDVTREMLDVRQGDALAVNFPLQLHHTPDESVDVTNPRDGLLRMVKSLSPKVVTLVEQESNTNTTPFFNRFVETLEYYLAMFESIDANASLPRENKDRINVEQHCLARDIVNIIACEGKDRVERHELFGKWKSRFTMAGFRQYPLSSYVNSVIRTLLRRYSEHYTLDEKDGAILLGWKNRNLISASAWY